MSTLRTVSNTWKGRQECNHMLGDVNNFLHVWELWSFHPHLFSAQVWNSQFHVETAACEEMHFSHHFLSILGNWNQPVGFYFLSVFVEHPWGSTWKAERKQQLWLSTTYCLAFRGTMECAAVPGDESSGHLDGKRPKKKNDHGISYGTLQR